MRLFRGRLAQACVNSGIGRLEHASIPEPVGPSMRLFRGLLARACVYFGVCWPTHGISDSPLEGWDWCDFAAPSGRGVEGEVSGRSIQGWERVGNSRWHGAALSALVSRSRAVPAPTGRTGQRSAFPGRRAALPGGVRAETCAIAELGSTPSCPAARGGAGVNAPPGELAGVPGSARNPGCWRPGAPAFSQQPAVFPRPRSHAG